MPTNQLDAIRKYTGGDALNPPISSLGSKDWIKTKEISMEIRNMFLKFEEE